MFLLRAALPLRWQRRLRRWFGGECRRRNILGSWPWWFRRPGMVVELVIWFCFVVAVAVVVLEMLEWIGWRLWGDSGEGDPRVCEKKRREEVGGCWWGASCYGGATTSPGSFLWFFFMVNSCVKRRKISFFFAFWSIHLLKKLGLINLIGGRV